MAYRGKLSKACKECRSRKTRCDTARPSCAQCRRAGRSCSGYRDVQALRVLNQTNYVKIQHYGPHRALESSKPPVPKSMTTTVVVSPLCPPFLEPLEVLKSAAPAVFFAELLNTCSTWTKTDLQWVSLVYGKVEPDGTLADMISTLGIVAFARKSKDQSMMRPAAQKYAQVLRRTRSALADPNTAASDEMLATVWLLSVHESIVKDSTQSHDRASVHLEGAAKLLLLRGASQFRTIIGKCMFSRVLALIIMDYLQLSKPVPQDLLKLMETNLENHFPEVQCYLKLLGLAGRLCTLISPEYNVQFQDIRAKHKALVDLDNELAVWPTDIGERYSCSRVIATDKGYPREYDLYTSHVAAVSLNEYRRIRIHVNEHILRYAELITYSSRTTPDDEITISKQRTLTILSQLAEDICYSVPYFLEKSIWAKDGSERGGSDFTMYGGSAIIVPLSLATNEEWVSSEMYGWMLGQIDRITKRTGITRTGQYQPLMPASPRSPAAPRFAELTQYQSRYIDI